MAQRPALHPAGDEQAETILPHPVRLGPARRRRRRRLRLDRDRRRLDPVRRRLDARPSAPRRSRRRSPATATAAKAPTSSTRSTSTTATASPSSKPTSRAQEASPFDPFGEPEAEGGGTATGSGFVIDTEGHILTNNHVVEGAEQDRRSNSAHRKGPTPAKVVGTDPATDLALLKVDAPADQLHPLTLGDSSEVEVGDPVVAIGNPFGLDRTVTSGIVSALQRQIQAPDGFSISNVIQTDAAINPGNSGGPLIDAEGEVIGINSQIETGGGGNGNVGIGFAIPINTAARDPSSSRPTARSSTPTSASAAARSPRNWPRRSTCRSTKACSSQSVVKGGPADKAGIEGGNTSATIEGAEVSLGGDIITEARRQEDRRDGRTGRTSSTRKKPGEDTRTDGAARRQRKDRHRDARRPPRLGQIARHAARISVALRQIPGTQAVRRAALPYSGWMRVKFCGITNLDDAAEAVRLGAWAIGLIHYDGSPRHVRAGRRGRDRGCLQAQVRGRRRLRQPDPGGGRQGGRGRRADDGAAERRRGASASAPRWRGGPGSR